jgi:hypothetical protein
MMMMVVVVMMMIGGGVYKKNLKHLNIHLLQISFSLT